MVKWCNLLTRPRHQVPTINDLTQAELQEIRDTGALGAGDKPLNELKKRKLVAQKYVVYLYLPLVHHFSLSFVLESSYGSLCQKAPTLAHQLPNPKRT